MHGDTRRATQLTLVTVALVVVARSAETFAQELTEFVPVHEDLGFDLESLDPEEADTCTLNLLQRSAVAHQRINLQQIQRSFGQLSAQPWLTSRWAWRPSLEDGLPREFVGPALVACWMACAIYVVCIVWDVKKLWVASKAGMEKEDHCEAESERAAASKVNSAEWSSLGIWMLCFYRLYTGFLAATWLPYVLAMEGATLWPANQSLFMGIAKLIYGITVLMNPMFGLIGDILAEVCQGAARRLWILLGIVLSALGIMVCLHAGPAHEFYYYMFGITLWRLGEALNDVTTEAIVPELVPTHQFGLASSIKAASFLLGGLLGYCLLFFMADVHYTWCYFAYLGAMFICAVPSLLLLVNDAPLPPNPFRTGKSFMTNMRQAYITPFMFEGGFPEISLAIFVMSCGTAPMFFFLLILRDLVGVHQATALQQDFAIGSVTFFLAAAIATIGDVTIGGRVGPSSRGEYLDAEALRDMSPRSRAEHLEKVEAWEKEKIRRLKVLVGLSLVFAVSVLVMPSVQFFRSMDGRFEVFYPIVAVFGCAFGLGYSRFQDATWRLLPNNCDMANAMGFNVMARNFGLGVGNFFFGAMLECFKVKYAKSSTTITTTPAFTIEALTSSASRQVYSDSGYDFMCFGCMVFNVVAGLITYRITWLVPMREAEKCDEDNFSQCGSLSAVDNQRKGGQVSRN